MKRACALVAASAVVLAACGSESGDAVDVSGDEPRTIEVAMTEMAFTPSTVGVEAGETVTFIFRNDGAVRHEALIGDLAEQEAHHSEMAEMEGDHDGMDMGSTPGGQEPHSVVVDVGDTVEVTHTFGAESTMIGCHEPGHWEAGMKMDIDV